MLIDFLSILNDDDFIINVPASNNDQTTITIQSAAIDNNMIDETNQ